MEFDFLLKALALAERRGAAAHLGGAPWGRARPRRSGGGCAASRPPLCDHSVGGRGRQARTRDGILRPAQPAPFPRLRDAALRADLAAARPARRSAGGAQSARTRRRRGLDPRGGRPARTPAAARVHRLALVVPREGRQVRSDGDDETVERARLPARRAGRRARRVRGPRRRVRRVPDRQRNTRARRSIRRRDRNVADVRPADATLGRAYRQDRDPSRPRVPVRRGGDQGVSRTLPRALPRRAGPLSDIPDDLGRTAAGRHRVLPAVVLQDDGVVVRLPPPGHAVHRGGGCARDARRVVATGR